MKLSFKSSITSLGFNYNPFYEIIHKETAYLITVFLYS